MKLPYRRFLQWLRQHELTGRRNAPFRFAEELETRRLLSTFNWIGGNGDWEVAANWVNTSNGLNQLPGPGDDVVINAAVAITHSHGTDSVNSIITNSTIALSGGTLIVATTMDIEANFPFTGGTLSGPTINSSDGSKLLLGTGENLSAATIGAGVTVDAAAYPVSLTVTNGLTLNGTFNLGDSGNNYGRVYFYLTQNLGGSGTINLGASNNNIIYAQGNNGSIPGTLTIGNGVTIQGKSGAIEGYFNIDSVLNNGTIDATGGGTITVSGGGNPGSFSNTGTLKATGGGALAFAGPWTNSGNLSETNSQLILGGTFPLSALNLATFTRTGGTVNLTGTLTNTGTLALTTTTGNFNLVGGTILGGVITDVSGGLLVLTNNGGTLNAVTIPAGTVLDGTQISNANVTVTGGMTLNGVINLGDAATNYARAYFYLSQSLTGSGTINLGASTNNIIYAEGNNGSIPGTLTIGSGITIQGKSGFVEGYFNIDAVVNNGTIAETGGGTITLEGGGNPGSFTNAGVLKATGGALAFAGPWTNSGTLTETNAVLLLGGTFPVANFNFGGFSRSGGTVNLTGTLTNNGTTLALNPSTGNWNLSGGAIVGGVITDTAGALLVLTNNGGTLNAVTIPAGTVLDGTQISNASITVTGGMTLNGVINLGDAATNYARAYFYLSQSLTGSGTINLGASTNNIIYAEGNNGNIPGTLTIGSGITIQGKSGFVEGYFNIDAVVNNGTIAETGGGTITLEGGGNPGGFANNGVLQATGGALAFAGPWTNSGTLSETNAVLLLGGTFSVANFNFAGFSRSGGTVNLTGTLTNNGTTLALNPSTGNWNLSGGAIVGGVITDTAGGLLVLTNNGGTLNAVTIPAGTVLDGTQISNANVTVTGGMTLNGVINLGDTASNYARAYFYLAQNLNGSGTISLGNSSNNIIYAEGNNGNIPATLTIGSGISIQAKNGALTGYFSIDSIINNGTISVASGGAFSISGGGSPAFFANGGMIQTTAGTLSIQGPFTNQAGGSITATNSLLNLGSGAGTWSNAGVLSEINSAVDLGGSFTVAGLGTFNRTGGTVNLTGNINATGTALALNPTTGSWNLNGGTVTGGSITNTGGASLILTNNGGVLSGVTIPAGASVDGTEISNAYASFVNGLTLNGLLNLGNATNSFYGRAFFYLTQSLTGTGTIALSSSASNAIYAEGNNGNIPATLTIGSGITIQGAGGALSGYFSIDSIINDGTIIETGGGPLTLSGGGGTSGSFTNAGNVSVGTGGTLSLQGVFANQAGGTITASNAWLLLGSGASAWSNAGAIVATNSVVNLGGSFSKASLGNFTRNGGTVNLTGDLLNTGATLPLDPTTGSWNLAGGTITGGTLTDTGGAALILTNSGGWLTSLTIPVGTVVDGTQSPNGYADVSGGLTLNGIINLGDLNTNVGRLYFYLTQTLAGTGTVTMGTSTSNTVYAEGNNGNIPGTLTIANGIAIQAKSGAVSGYFTIDTVVNNGTITETGGGSLKLSGGGSAIFTNSGHLATSSGGTLALQGPFINQSTGAINASGASLFLGSGSGAWSNAGAIVATNSVVNLGGSFSVAGLGSFTRTSGTVNLTGNLANAGTTLPLNGQIGSWNLAGGTITGGTITGASSSALVLTSSGGVLNGVVISSGAVVDGSISSGGYATIVNNMTLNGNILLGDASGSFYGRLYFAGSQYLAGSGSVTLGGSTSDNISSEGVNGTAATLTIASSMTVQGKSGGITGYNSSDAFVNNGAIIETGGGTFTLSSGGGFINNGAISAIGTGSINVNGTLITNDPAIVTTAPSNVLNVTGNFLGNTKDAGLFQIGGRINLTGSGTGANPQLFEAMSQDLGAGSNAFVNNFAIGSMNISVNDYVKLVDQAHNTGSASPEAVYVNSLNVPSGSTLNLGGLHLYVRNAQIAGTVIGAITQIPNAGALTVNSPTPGHISTAGELDSWTFFDTAGQSISVLLDPGSNTAGGPLSPALNWAQISLLDPSNHVVASATSSTAGGVISLSNVTLPADGTYTITVKAASSQSASTGNYILSAYNVTPNIQSLDLNQSVAGKLATPFGLDQWNFAAAGGTQVQFNLAAGSSPGLVYTLNGPNGFVGFTNATGSSALVDLPTSGVYTLSAQGSNGASGSYGFQITQTSVTQLPLSTPLSGTLVASGQAQLFAIPVTATNPMTIVLNDAAISDHTEVYARFGAPPTRQTYDIGANGSGSSHTLLVPSANVGTWYVLVYAEHVTSANTPFTLRADSAPLVISTVTPDHYGASANASLTVTGAGFDPTATVSLVASNNTVYPASGVTFDTFTQLTASIDLTNVPQGVYTVRVSRSDNSTDDLPNAFTVTSSGQAILQTKLTVPGSVGRHIAATFYVTYSNTGNIAMPAPLLLLESSVADDRPLFTLDPSLVNAGFWTSALPKGYSNTVEILGSGKVPGTLGPGESVTIPVYYAGMEQPWNFNEPQFHFDIRSFEASDTDAVDWTALQSSLEPTGIPAGPWSTIFGNLQAQLGTTDGGYVQLLDSEAAYLGQLGENVTNVNQLWSFAVEQANNAMGPLAPYLASGTDASLATPGSIPLAFTRVFSQSVTGRDQAGILGDGWSTTWDTHLSVSADGTVTIHTVGGAERIFQPDSRTVGAYFSQNGDPGVLTTDGGGNFLVTEANGSITAFLANGLLNYVQDSDANRITASYTNSQLTRLTASSGQYLAFTYNGAGLLSSVTDSLGRATTYTYDNTNTHLATVTWSNGEVTTYAYITSGVAQNTLASISFPGGTHEFFTYDAQGRIIGTTSDGGAQPLTFGYSLGLVTTTDATGDTSKLYFNQAGEIVKSVDALGNATFRTFDTNNFVTSITDPAGVTESYSYNAAGYLTSVTDYNGGITSYTYAGANNRLSSSTDADGNATTYAYNTHGDLLSATYANGSSKSYTYDPQGNALSFVDQGGQAINYTYNSAGLVTNESFADGSSFAFTYDAHENLLSATDASGTINFTYNAIDLLTNVAYPDGSSLAFTYGAAGRRTRMADQTGYTVNYTYDALGRLSQLTDAGSNVIAAYTYDADGRLSRTDKGNGTYVTYAYDAAGNLLHLINYAPGNVITSRFDYAWNSLGLEASEATLDGTWTYSYDADGQLTHATFASTNANIPSQDLKYAYDAAGNRTTTVLNSATTAYVVNAMNRYTSVGNATYTYDADGNLTSDGTNSYTYNQLGELTSLTTPGGTTTYTYNAIGQLASSSSGGQVTTYLSDPTGNSGLIGTFHNGTALSHNAYGYGLVSQSAGGTTDYYNFDAIGNTVGVTNSAGAIVDTYAYAPFGGGLYTSGATPNSFQFAGQFGVQTLAPGIIDMGARIYSANTGRFDAPDPLGLSGGNANVYTFVFNRPTSLVDPLGTVPAPATLSSRLVLPGAIAAGVFNTPGKTGKGVSSSAWINLLKLLLSKISHQGANQGWLGGYVIVGVSGSSGGTHSTTPTHNDTGPTSPDTDPNDDSDDDDDDDDNDDGPNSPGPNDPGPNNPGPDNPNTGPSNGPNNPSTPNDPANPTDPAPTPTPPGGNPKNPGTSAAPNSMDPNAMIGPAGFGTSGYISTQNALFPYQIDFENSASATAPAQRVVVTDQLSANFDWSTFQLTGVGFGDHHIAIPAGSQSFQTTVPMTYNGKTFNVQIQLGIHSSTGQVYAIFSSVDPNTGLPPDVLAGFLPPEDGTGRGQGYFSFLISPKASLPTGTQIKNVAVITFDSNPPIATNQVSDSDPSQGTDPTKEALVTADNGAPASSVVTIPGVTTSPSFTLNWSGQDDALGSGIADFDVYVSTDGGPYSLFTSGTLTSALFTGQTGHTYSFYSVATDNVGLVQPTPSAAQATTFVTNVLTASKLAFTTTPTTVYAGQTITPAISIAVEDVNGHIVTSDSSTITLQLATGPGGSKLTGTLQLPVVNGVATFTDLEISKLGDFTLAASDGSLTATTSGTITAALPPTHLVFGQQPLTVVAGQDITPLVVFVEDASGHIVTTDSSAVTVSIPAGATTLGGTTTVHAINGSAVFTDLVLIGAGKYTFSATDAVLASAKSKALTITPDLSSSQLFIKQPPAISLVGKPLFPAILVSVDDQFGNLITTDHSLVTLSIFSGPLGSTLAGSTSAAASKGVATFKNIIPSTAGSYVLHANDSSLQVTAALAINATVSRAVTSVATPKVSATYLFGQTITLGAALKSTAPSGVPFTGSVSVVDNNSQTVATTTLAANGSAKFALTDLAPGTYTLNLSYPGDANHTAADSSTFTFKINPDPTKTSLKASASQIAAGTSLTLTATIAAAGNPQLPGTVTFFDNGVAFGSPVTPDANDTAEVVVPAPAAGSHNYTAEYSGNADFFGSTSGKAGVTVKGAATKVALAPSVPSPIAANTPFALTATVSLPANSGLAAPTGAVVFEDNATPIGTVTLSGPGTATLTGVTFTAAGHHTLLAIYAGDALDNPATSLKVTLTIT